MLLDKWSSPKLLKMDIYYFLECTLDYFYAEDMVYWVYIGVTALFLGNGYSWAISPVTEKLLFLFYGCFSNWI